MATTQVLHPTRATIRTVLAAVVAFAGIFPLIVNTAHLPEWSGVTVAVAVAAGITRVMALPAVENFLHTYVPWLSAAPSTPAAADVAVPEPTAFIAKPPANALLNSSAPVTTPVTPPAPPTPVVPPVTDASVHPTPPGPPAPPVAPPGTPVG